LEKSEGGYRESAGLMTISGFSGNFSFSGGRFADTFLDGTFGRSRETTGKQPRIQEEAKMVCHDPGFYQVRDKDVQSDSVNINGNFVPDERKLVRTQRSV
jgi:hypothetical protein